VAVLFVLRAVPRLAKRSLSRAVLHLLAIRTLRAEDMADALLPTVRHRSPSPTRAAHTQAPRGHVAAGLAPDTWTPIIGERAALHAEIRRHAQSNFAHKSGGHAEESTSKTRGPKMAFCCTCSF
jgi:hypothetical protein